MSTATKAKNTRRITSRALLALFAASYALLASPVRISGSSAEAQEQGPIYWQTPAIARSYPSISGPEFLLAGVGIAASILGAVTLFVTSQSAPVPTALQPSTPTALNTAVRARTKHKTSRAKTSKAHAPSYLRWGRHIQVIDPRGNLAAAEMAKITWANYQRAAERRLTARGLADPAVTLQPTDTVILKRHTGEKGLVILHSFEGTDGKKLWAVNLISEKDYARAIDAANLVNWCQKKDVVFTGQPLIPARATTAARLLRAMPRLLRSMTEATAELQPQDRSEETAWGQLKIGTKLAEITGSTQVGFLRRLNAPTMARVLANAIVPPAPKRIWRMPQLVRSAPAVTEATPA